MTNENPIPRRRGRPPKHRDDHLETRELLLRAGLEVLTEKGFSATGLDEILKRVGVPKGSFYHYFDSKEDFGRELIKGYDAYFSRKLRTYLDNPALSPINRLKAFSINAVEGMARFGFRRGCLIGNLGQEMGALPESFRLQLMDVFENWQAKVAVCLVEAQEAGELAGHADPGELATLFWIGWEGAVLRAKLEQSEKPLEMFADYFFANLPRD